MPRRVLQRIGEINALGRRSPAHEHSAHSPHHPYSVHAPQAGRPQFECRLVKRGQRACIPGQPLDKLVVVRTGVFKIVGSFVDGSTQIFGFPMAGDALGLEAVRTGFHICEAVSLEDSVVYELSFGAYERWLQVSPTGQRRFAKALADQVIRAQELLLLREAPAELRLASFLLDLSDRYFRLSYSRSRFVLRMTRQEIGAYLGLKLETVSRHLSQLQRGGLIQVEGKSIALLDFPALCHLSGQSSRTLQSGPVLLVTSFGELLEAG